MKTLKKIKEFLIFPVLPMIIVLFLPLNIYIINPFFLESSVENHLLSKNLNKQVEKFELHRQSLINNESIIVVKFIRLYVKI